MDFLVLSVRIIGGSLSFASNIGRLARFTLVFQWEQRVIKTANKLHVNN